MTNVKRKVLLVVLALVSALFAFSGICGFVNAKADATPKSLADISFVMEESAVARVDGNNGLKFSAKLSSSDYEGILANYKTIKYGMFVMPEYYVEEVGELNEENTFGSSAKYVWGNSYANQTVVNGKYRIIHMESAAVKSGTKYVIKGSVKDFLAENLATDYVACAYIKATTNNNQTEYKFADLSNFDPTSMLEVAFKALNSGNYDAANKAAEKAILEGYKTAYIAELGSTPSYSYTVNYVAGNEIIDTVTVGDIAMNTPVSITAEAPEGYIVAGETNISAHVYASDIVINVALGTFIEGDLYNGEIAYLEKLESGWNIAETQYIVLPEPVGVVTDFKIGGYEIDFTYDSATNSIAVSAVDLDAWLGGVYVATFKGENDAVYAVKLTIADRIIDDASEVAKMTATFGSPYIVIGADVDAGSVAQYPYGSEPFSGTIDGKGNILYNYTIEGWWGITLYGWTNATIKNLAFVNIDNPGYRGIFSPSADNVLIENVYINGLSDREQLFAVINEGGITVKDLVLNFEDGWDSKGCICSFKTDADGGVSVGTITGEEGVDYYNIWSVDGSAAQSFMANNLGLSFGDFEVTVEGLTFNGKMLIEMKGTAVEGALYNGEVAYLEKTSAEATQSFVLPAVANVSKVYVAGIEVAYDATSNTATVNTADLADLKSGIQTLSILAEDGTLYQAKLTVADYVINNDNEAGKIAYTDGDNYIVLATNIDASGLEDFNSVTPTEVFTGTIDGKGNTISNLSISTSVGWWGILGRTTPDPVTEASVPKVFAGTIKNIAFINVYNPGSMGLFSRVVDGGTIENVYIEGRSNREQLFATIGDNGLTVSNLILDFEDGWASKGCICTYKTDKGDPESTGTITGEENTAYYNIWGNATWLADNVGFTLGDFEVKADGLYFGDTLIKAVA